MRKNLILVFLFVLMFSCIFCLLPDMALADNQGTVLRDKYGKFSSVQFSVSSNAHATGTVYRTTGLKIWLGPYYAFFDQAYLTSKGFYSSSSSNTVDFTASDIALRSGASVEQIRAAANDVFNGINLGAQIKVLRNGVVKATIEEKAQVAPVFNQYGLGSCIAAAETRWAWAYDPYKPISYTLTMQIEGQGSTTPVGSKAPGTVYNNKSGTESISASPVGGWKFAHWIDVSEGNVQFSTNPSASVVMNKNRIIRAVFIPDAATPPAVTPSPPEPPAPEPPPPPPPPPNYDPIADFDISNPSLVEGETVQLRDRSTHPGAANGESIVSWEWLIQSGTPATATTQNTSTTWEVVGTYKITLRVEDQDGDSDSCTKSVVVGPALPAAVITISSDSIMMGREFHVDGDESTAAMGRDIKWDKMEWKIYGPDGILKRDYIGRYPLGKGTPNERTLTNSVLNQTGNWTIKLKVKDTNDNESEWAESIFKIYPDQPPIADFWLVSETLRNSYQGNEITVHDQSHPAAPDGALGDEIFQRTWSLYYDANNTGAFTVAGADSATLTTTSGNDQYPKIRFYKTGRYKLELTIRERAVVWGTLTNGLTGNTSGKALEEKQVVVINLAPTTAFEIKKKMPVDVLFTADTSIAQEKYNSLQSSLAEFTGTLEAGYINPAISTEKASNTDLYEYLPSRIADMGINLWAPQDHSLMKLQNNVFCVTLINGDYYPIYQQPVKIDMNTGNIKKIIDSTEWANIGNEAIPVKTPGSNLTIERSVSWTRTRDNYGTYTVTNTVRNSTGQIVGSFLDKWTDISDWTADYRTKNVFLLPNGDFAYRNDTMTTVFSPDGSAKWAKPFNEGVLVYDPIVPWYRWRTANFLLSNTTYNDELFLGTIPMITVAGDRNYGCGETTKLINPVNGADLVTIPSKYIGNTADKLLTFDVPPTTGQAPIDRIYQVHFYTNRNGLAALKKAVNNHSWDTQKTNFVVSVIDGDSYKDYATNNTSTISQLKANHLKLAVISPSTGQTKAQGEYLMNQAEGGWWIQTQDTMPGPLAELAQKIIAQVNQERGADNILLVNQKVELTGNYSDPETDPVSTMRWEFNHDPYKLGSYSICNSMGISYLNGAQLSVPPTCFDKVGTFLVRYRAKDNPVTNAAYINDPKAGAKWSSMDAYLTVLVHRKPIAAFTLSSTTIYKTGNLVITDNSYDPDLVNTDPEGKKGLRNWEWQYRNTTTGEEWKSSAVVPSSFTSKGVYAIRLRVRDAHGAWSDWTDQKLFTVLNNKPIAAFDALPNPVFVNNPCSLIDSSYDPDGDPLASWEWTIQGIGTLNKVSAAPFPVTWPNVGDYLVTLRVKDSEGIWSDPVSHTVKVINYFMLTLESVSIQNGRGTATATPGGNPPGPSGTNRVNAPVFPVNITSNVIGAYSLNQQVTLTAEPVTSGTYFVEWREGDEVISRNATLTTRMGAEWLETVNNNTTCTIRMTGNRTITAVFMKDPDFIPAVPPKTHVYIVK